MGARQPRNGYTESVSREVAVGNRSLLQACSPVQPSPAERSHRAGLSPEFLDPPEIYRNLWKSTFLRAIPCSFGSSRCATMHRNGSGPSVNRYNQPTDLIWMPAGSLRQLLSPSPIGWSPSFGTRMAPKAFRIRRTGPAAPARAGDDQDGFQEGCLAQIKVEIRCLSLLLRLDISNLS